MQALGGTAEVEFFGDSGEVAQVAEFDFCIHILNVSIYRNKILDILHHCKETDDVAETGAESWRKR